jgi:adenylate cyclase
VAKDSPQTGAGALRHPRRWPFFLDRIVSFAVVPGDSADTIRTKRIFTAALWAALPASISSSWVLLGYEARWAALAVTVPFVTAAISLIAMRVNPSAYPGIMHLVAAGTIATSLAIVVMFGGIFESASGPMWSLLAVFGAVLVFGDRRAHFWMVVFVVTGAAAAVLTTRIDPLYTLPNPEHLAVYNLVTVSLFVYTLLYYLVRKSDALLQQADRLLRNVLPDQVAERLKVSEEMIADEYESASILFADVTGFTQLAATLQPGEVVDLLNALFIAFDELVETRGLEKIKTIGDAYMVAGGVPVTRGDHARAICELALDMQSHLETERFGGHQLSMRIGIASGPVTAGIIGRKKFAYDLWGDTVNLASRMESTGVPGRIQISKATRDLVSGWFDIQPRGMVEMRGKGNVETWFLVARAADDKAPRAQRSSTPVGDSSSTRTRKP